MEYHREHLWKLLWLKITSWHYKKLKCRSNSTLKIVFSRKITSAPKYVEKTLNATGPKVSYICGTNTASPKFYSVCIDDCSLFQIIEVFYFGIGYNVELELKNIYIYISFKNSQRSFVRTIGRKFSGKICKVLAVTCRSSGFKNIGSRFHKNKRKS